LPAEGRLDEGSDLLDSKEFAPCQSSEDGTGGREQSLPPAPHPSLRHAPQHSPGCGARLGARAGRFAVGTSRACGPPAAPVSATRTSAPPTSCPHDGYAARVPFARWRRRPQGGRRPRAIALHWPRQSCMASPHAGPREGLKCLPSKARHATFAQPDARGRHQGRQAAAPTAHGSNPCVGR
jgi:hypothetical protein